MPRSLAHFGPVELEQDIQQDPPAERVEHFLCVVLGLLLNRKQDIKYVGPVPSFFRTIQTRLVVVKVLWHDLALRLLA